MNLSTPSTPKAAEPRAILLLGGPGGGKTTLSMQFPFPCFLDCDRNLDGSEGFVRSKNPKLEYGYTQVTYQDGKPVPIEKCYDRLISELDSISKEPQVKTVVIDGITLINNFIIAKVQKEQGTEEMKIPSWGRVANAFVKLLIVKVRETGKNTIVTCHETPVERPSATNPLLKELIRYDPAISGGIANVLGGLFTDVWRCSSEAGTAGRVQFRIQFTKDNKSGDLKNSLGITQDMIINQGELAWTKLEPYLKAYL